MKKWKERALQYGRMYLSVAEKRDVLQAQVSNLAKQLAGRDMRIDELEADKEALNVAIMGLQADLRWMREQQAKRKCATCRYYDNVYQGGVEGRERGMVWVA